MDNDYYIRVPRPPKALKRHRTVMLKNGHRLNYDPSKTDKKDFIAAIVQNAPKEPMRGPIFLDVQFGIPRPKNHYGTGKNAQKLKDSAPNWCTKRPDIDNYLKFIMDALNGIYFHDDSQIAKVIMEKIYSKSPGTVIHIMGVND